MAAVTTIANMNANKRFFILLTPSYLIESGLRRLQSSNAMNRRKSAQFILVILFDAGLRVYDGAAPSLTF
jgi:hypothetical protein